MTRTARIIDASHHPCACPVCGCQATARAAHAIAAALAIGDLDTALRHGLLDTAACTDCSAGCRAGIAAARQRRLDALSARARHRARNARLSRREQTKMRQRADAARQPCALPTAAAAALARAKAKAIAQEMTPDSPR